MHSIAFSAAALLATLVPATLAQTFTACNPLNETGCPNMDALGAEAKFDFNDTINIKIWDRKTQGKIETNRDGTLFTVARSGDSPMLQSTFYMLFGRVEAVYKAARGQGIISTVILQSECLDEIDWEVKGGNTTHSMTNYYGKGNTTDLTRGRDYPVSIPPQDEYYNYTIDWTKDRIQWWMNDKMMRELKPEEAWGGRNYPQTPMNIRVGAWSAGDKDKNAKGVVEWAGGETDFSKAPFTMTLKSIYAKDYTVAKEYSWENMDKSGSWEKVKIIEPGTKSESLEEIEKPHGVKNRWKALSKGAQIAIIGGSAGALILGALIITFCCIKQRRAGRKEFAAFQAEENKAAADLAQHKQMWQGSHRASNYRRI